MSAQLLMSAIATPYLKYKKTEAFWAHDNDSTNLCVNRIVAAECQGVN